MLFCLYNLDRPQSLPVRQAHRAAHIAYLESQGERLVAAGPLLSDDGEAMIGSLIILDCADRAEAEAFAAGDPYAAAGLFETVTIRPWRRVFPRS
jgi:uncharacterized protein YciI